MIQADQLKHEKTNTPKVEVQPKSKHVTAAEVVLGITVVGMTAILAPNVAGAITAEAETHSEKSTSISAERYEQIEEKLKAEARESLIYVADSIIEVDEEDYKQHVERSDVNLIEVDSSGFVRYHQYVRNSKLVAGYNFSYELEHSGSGVELVVSYDHYDHVPNQAATGFLDTAFVLTNDDFDLTPFADDKDLVSVDVDVLDALISDEDTHVAQIRTAELPNLDIRSEGPAITSFERTADGVVITSKPKEVSVDSYGQSSYSGTPEELLENQLATLE